MLKAFCRNKIVRFLNNPMGSRNSVSVCVSGKSSLKSFPKQMGWGWVCVCVCACTHEMHVCSAVSHSLSNPLDYSLPSSSVHRIFQARILAWVGISYSRRSSPRDRSCVSWVSCIGMWIPHHWTNREPPGQMVSYQLKWGAVRGGDTQGDHKPIWGWKRHLLYLRKSQELKLWVARSSWKRREELELNEGWSPGFSSQKEFKCLLETSPTPYPLNQHILEA